MIITLLFGIVNKKAKIYFSLNEEKIKKFYKKWKKHLDKRQKVC